MALKKSPGSGKPTPAKKSLKTPAAESKPQESAKPVAGAASPAKAKPSVRSKPVAKPKPATKSVSADKPKPTVKAAPVAKPKPTVKSKPVAKPKPATKVDKAAKKKPAIEPVVAAEAASTADTLPAAKSQSATKAAKQANGAGVKRRISSGSKRTVSAPDVDAADETEANNPDKADDVSTRPSVTRKHRRWPWVVALSIVAVLVVMAASFSWDRWLRYDDAHEFQGEWQINDAAKVVVVDGTAIKLTDEVSYIYTLDTDAKTISFTFGNMSGSGRYRFSADRSQLVIMEGETHSTASTLFDDIAWMWDGLVRSVQGQEPAAPVPNDHTLVLNRVSHDATAQPHALPSVSGSAETPDTSADAANSDATSGDATKDAAPEVAPETTPEAAPEDASEAAASPDEKTAETGTNTPSNESSSSLPDPKKLFDVSDVVG